MRLLRLPQSHLHIPHHLLTKPRLLHRLPLHHLPAPVIPCPAPPVVSRLSADAAVIFAWRSGVRGGAAAKCPALLQLLRRVEVAGAAAAGMGVFLGLGLDWGSGVGGIGGGGG